MDYREVHVGVNPRAMEIDSGEKRLNELGYKQELRREMVYDTFVYFLFKTFAITFSTMAFFIGTPLYGPSLLYAGPASLIWGYVAVTFFTWFVGFAMAEICSSFPTTGSLYFWAAHLAGARWGPFASWCCAWLETMGAYSGAQTLQMIILLSTGTNKGGGYFAPRSVFLYMYIGLIIIWAVLNSFALQVIAFLNVISVWWQVMQVIGGLVVIIGLPLVASTTQSASYVFTHFETSPETTGIHSKPYAVILSETKGADRTGPMAILSSIGIISAFGWAYILALTFSIQDLAYLYDPNNETGGAFVPAQIIYDAFYRRYHSGIGAIIFLCIIWGTFFFGGLSVITSVYALSRDGGIPFSPIWRKIHPKHKVPLNAVWLCAVIFTAIVSISTIGWVGAYAIPIFARLVMDEKNFRPGPFYLGRASRPVCLISFLYIFYTCSIFLLPTLYPLRWDTFNYAPVAVGLALALILLWWVLDARKWFKGPVRNIKVQNGSV
ncbi:amino-acid permease BAT1 homolog [Fagus crenata]